ncbi:hypothetical protein GCM10025868_44080 [Angustibacter aerolatus]|uniref:ScyD/ScyE family protein n=1 Tax=Angustibacter aerolatus TaxID=1162965 RepID=A0ABQ6JLN4_9ACTN|nr:hypothetical protein GCM10025868_44080 [Angustibacter aerolatus]
MKADLGAFEAAKNPDAGVQYGIDDPTDCQKAAFEPLGGASPTGGVDSHAYAVAADGSGWIVADAGGNDLLRVSSTGKVSLLTVLPRQPSTITASAAAALGLPDCVIGAVYNFEPVPTDVEWRGGRLIVSLLPGGPEDPSLGARGSVYSVHPHSGKATWLAGGFLGATNVAVGHRGEIYVAEPVRRAGLAHPRPLVHAVRVGAGCRLDHRTRRDRAVGRCAGADRRPGQPDRTGGDRPHRVAGAVPSGESNPPQHPC